MSEVVHEIETDVLVVGGGLAGCWAAIRARERGASVVLVDRGPIGNTGCSRFASGHIKCFMSGDDLPQWIEGIVAGGDYLNDQRWLEVVFLESFDRVKDTEALGVHFEKTDGEFRRERGRGSAYHKTVPAQRRWVDVRAEAARLDKVFVTTRLGYGRIEENIRSLQSLEREAGIGGATIHIDSYTRWFQFEKAARLVEEEYRVGQNRLNGYAFAYYGYKRFREILESVNIPIGTVGGGQDGRLWNEFSVASGVTSGGGSFVPNPFTYTDNKLSLEEVLFNGVYGLRMNAWYSDRGVELETGVRGCNSGTARPPSISRALTLVELLTAAAQGARNFSAKYYQHGSFVQDVAYLRAVAPSAALSSPAGLP